MTYQDQYRVSGLVPAEFESDIKVAAADVGLPLQNWVGNACTSKLQAQNNLNDALGLAKLVAASKGVPPEVFITEAIRSYICLQLEQPSIAELTRQHMSETHSGLNEDLANLFYRD